MSARERLVNTLMDTREDVLDYVEERRRVESAVLSDRDHSGKYLVWRYSPMVVADQFEGEGSSTTRAAFLMGAVAYRALLYASPTENPKPFSAVWERTCLRRLAAESEKQVAELSPRTKGAFTTIDLERMRTGFWGEIERGRPERVIFTGLNGAGKSTLIRVVRKFLELTGLEVEVLKFPRPEGLFSQLILPVLMGQEQIDPAALQLLMLADAIDGEVASTSDLALTLCDRHPIIDGLVYGPVGSFETVLLSSRELFTRPNWVLVVDRHPVMCSKRVGDRSCPSRIFERELEQMAGQVVRLAALSCLPGVIWVNNDIPEGECWQDVAQSSSVRVVGALLRKGIIQRAMVRAGLFETTGEAQSHAQEVFIKTKEWALFEQDKSIS